MRLAIVTSSQLGNIWKRYQEYSLTAKEAEKEYAKHREDDKIFDDSNSADEEPQLEPRYSQVGWLIWPTYKLRQDY